MQAGRTRKRQQDEVSVTPRRTSTSCLVLPRPGANNKAPGELFADDNLPSWRTWNLPGIACGPTAPGYVLACFSVPLFLSFFFLSFRDTIRRRAATREGRFAWGMAEVSRYRPLHLRWTMEKISAIPRASVLIRELIDFLVFINRKVVASTSRWCLDDYFIYF